MNKTLKRYLILFLRLTSMPFFIREVIQRKRVTILLYHEIKPSIFDMHIRILKSKYNIISLEDFVKAKKERRINSLPPKSLIITFDDGHESNYHLKPILEKHDVPVTIFLCSSIINTKRRFWFKHEINNNYSCESLKKIPDKNRLEILESFGFKETKEFSDRQALSKNEIEDMKNIVDFQSHTSFHSVLPKCSTDKAYEEITESKKELEKNYGLNIYALSYPNGDYSDRDITIAKKAGYACGITVDCGLNSQNTDIFRLKRLGISGDADANELLVKVSGLWCYLKTLFVGQSYGYIQLNKQKLKED